MDCGDEASTTSTSLAPFSSPYFPPAPMPALESQTQRFVERPEFCFFFTGQGQVNTKEKDGQATANQSLNEHAGKTESDEEYKAALTTLHLLTPHCEKTTVLVTRGMIVHSPMLKMCSGENTPTFLPCRQLTIRQHLCKAQSGLPQSRNRLQHASGDKQIWLFSSRIVR